jgi:hypothetical protein
VDSEEWTQQISYVEIVFVNLHLFKCVRKVSYDNFGTGINDEARAQTNLNDRRDGNVRVTAGEWTARNRHSRYHREGWHMRSHEESKITK